jgi:predicted RNA-binding protein Jag
MRGVELKDRKSSSKNRKAQLTKKRKPPLDETVRVVLDRIQSELQESFGPSRVEGLNGFQRKQIHHFFGKTNEYNVKTHKENENWVLKVYPIGKLRRIAEQKTQEVLMEGKEHSLPPMGSYQRFIIHDYLKERDGIRTESKGSEGKDRHVVIYPVFGRSLKKAKRRLMI